MRPSSTSYCIIQMVEAFSNSVKFPTVDELNNIPDDVNVHNAPMIRGAVQAIPVKSDGSTDVRYSSSVLLSPRASLGGVNEAIDIDVHDNRASYDVMWANALGREARARVEEDRRLTCSKR